METLQWKKILIPYEQAVKELEVKFQSIAHEYHTLNQYSPIELVTGRVKTISSILEKARKKNIPLSCIQDKIEDIAGIRIICQFVEDIDKVVALIRERDKKDLWIVEEKDYITHTKASGYRSYHIIIQYPVHTALGEKKVLAEIQIRTLAMNFWATIEHSLRYKYKQNMPMEINGRLLKAAEAAFKLDQEMSAIRSEILEAQELFQVRSNIVADIMKNIENLHVTGNLSEAEDIQRQFLKLWKEGDLQKLKNFNQQLDMIVQIYDVQSLS
ncbi:MAG: GTP pyrophosphokinase family protein [Epulopiscium sp.]|nr:GTP pyrophosphokinase family protein [Candidatus Epulonipiscium sp.]